MSKALSRVRALITEIDSIQTHGRKSPSHDSLMSSVHNIDPEPQKPAEKAVQNPPTEESELESATILSFAKPEKPVQPAETGKVLIQLKGNIAVQLQLDHTDEIVEVRQMGDSIEIRFTDGKAIHLPLKSVA